MILVNTEIERFTIGPESLMIVADQLVDPGLSLSLHRIGLLRVCTAFHRHPTLADSPYRISSSVDVENFGVFVKAINGAHFDITGENITDLLSLAAEFGFTQLFCQIEARGPRFPAARSATWDREDIHQLIACLPDATCS
jgi:hypothetical protein